MFQMSSHVSLENDKNKNCYPPHTVIVKCETHVNQHLYLSIKLTVPVDQLSSIDTKQRCRFYI